MATRKRKNENEEQPGQAPETPEEDLAGADGEDPPDPPRPTAQGPAPQPEEEPRITAGMVQAYVSEQIGASEARLSEKIEDIATKVGNLLNTRITEVENKIPNAAEIAESAAQTVQQRVMAAAEQQLEQDRQAQPAQQAQQHSSKPTVDENGTQLPVGSDGNVDWSQLKFADLVKGFMTAEGDSPAGHISKRLMNRFFGPDGSTVSAEALDVSKFQLQHMVKLATDERSSEMFEYVANKYYGDPNTGLIQQMFYRELPRFMRDAEKVGFERGRASIKEVPPSPGEELSQLPFSPQFDTEAVIAHLKRYIGWQGGSNGGSDHTESASTGHARSAASNGTQRETQKRRFEGWKIK